MTSPLTRYVTLDPKAPSPFGAAPAAGRSYHAFLRSYAPFGTVFDTSPHVSPERLAMVERWDRLHQQLAASRPAAARRSSRRFDDAARRVGVLSRELESLDVKLDALYGPVPPEEVLVDLLTLHVDRLGGSPASPVRVSASTRTARCLRSLPRPVRRTFGERVTVSHEPELSDEVVELRPPRPLPEPGSKRVVLDESWVLAPPPRGQRVVVPHLLLPPEGYEVFATLCADGMGHEEAAEAALRLATSR